MIIFVGDKASKKNRYKNIPFVGTKSHKTLLNWICDMQLDTNDILLCNTEHVAPYSYIPDIKIDVSNTHYDLDLKYDKVIALGEKAQKHLKKHKIPHYRIDHPSGLNRKLNDKKYVKKMLKDCKDYLEG